MIPGTYYHIYNRANGSENLFREHENYRYFLQQWHKYVTRVAQTLDYCLMPNHFHIFVKVDEETDIQQQKREKRDLQGFQYLKGLKISQQFSNLFNSYTKAYNKRYGRKGSLFSPNFKKKAITSDEYLATVTAYIHSNPVHYDFTNDFDIRPYSSFQSIIGNSPTFLKKSILPDRFGNKDLRKSFHSQAQLNLQDLQKQIDLLAVKR